MPADPVLDALRARFGFAAFRAGQEAVVRGLLAGRSMLAVFPTGGGKSLCYQLPAVMLDGLTLVISPLIALMKDQVDALRAGGVAAARLDSSLTADEAQATTGALRSGRLELLYIAPERLANERFRHQLRGVPIALVAIDEAHCISEWGHNFRPEYLKLARLCRRLRIPRVLALTATATPEVARDIRREFRIAAADHVQLSFHRPNLELRVTPCCDDARRQNLLDRLAGTAGAAIVYVTRQETAEEVATFLGRHGIVARAYHAGLPEEVRAAAQDGFMADTVRVVVATIAFGMGIDKPDIRAVLHYNLPKSLENYAQEIGRAGRDGGPARCELLACGDDLTVIENFVHGDRPTRQALRNLLDRVLRLGAGFDVSFYELSSSTDVRPLVVATVMTYLELDGVIAATQPFFAGYRVKLTRDFEAVLAGYDARRKAFLRKLFAAGEAGRTWLRFEVDGVAARIGETRARIVAALGHLADAGDLVLERSGARQGFRLCQDPGNLHELAARLDDRFAAREERDLARLREVLEFAGHPGCLTGFLTRRFGEQLAAPCGHCDRCRGIPPAAVPQRAPRTPEAAELAAIHTLAAERHAALASPRQLARFLCGIASPATTRERLTRHAAFGMLGDLPFAEVLALAETSGF
jgi:ATP-dependent DNA helicase RecQ